MCSSLRHCCNHLLPTNGLSWRFSVAVLVVSRNKPGPPSVISSQTTQSCSCSPILCPTSCHPFRTENLFSAVTTPSSIDEFNSQEIQTQQSTSSIFIPPHPTCSATTVLVNSSLIFSNFCRHCQYLRHLNLPRSHTSSSHFFYLGLVLSPPGFSFLDPFGGGFRGAAWLV